MRSFRWQLLALLASALVFVAVLFTRPRDDAQTPSQAQVSPSPAQIALTSATATITPEIEILPTAETGVVEPVQVGQAGDGVVTYQEALIGRVQRLNPLFASLNPVDADITALIFEGLTKINAYGEAVPALAKRWDISADGLEYVIMLRDDVFWQDGIPFNADDVIFTMSLLRSRNFPDPTLRAFWRTIETEKLSDTLVRFRLAQPLGGFPDALRIGILPYHALQGTSAAQLGAHPFNLSPIGTGPYQLEALRPDADGIIRTVELRVSPVYRQRPEGQNGYALDRVKFRLYDDFNAALQALQNGEVDGLAARNRRERPALLSEANAGRINLRNGIEPTVGFVIYNWRDNNFPVFREERVRLALDVGLNRASLVDRNLYRVAVLADSPLILGNWAYEPNLPWPAPDVGRARELLSTARIDLGGDDEATSDETNETAEITPEPSATPIPGHFSFAILTLDDPELVAVAQEIASQWTFIGLTVTVEAVDLTTYRARLEAGQFQAALVELSKEGSADPDVYAFWHQGQVPGADNPDGKNFGGANDNIVSEALEKGRREPFGLNRDAAYAEFQREFVRQSIAIPLYYPLFSYAFSPRVQNVQLGFLGAPSDRFNSIGQWTVSN